MPSCGGNLCLLLFIIIMVMIFFFFEVGLLLYVALAVLELTL